MITAHRRSSVARNTLASTFSQVGLMVLGFIAVPVILNGLGMTAFGVYSVLTSLTQYIGLLDLGIGGSLVRFMAFHREREEHDEAAAVATFGLLFYLVLGGLLLPLAIWGADAIAEFLNLPEQFGGALPLYLGALVAIFVGGSIMTIFGARLIAAHRMDLSAAASLCGGLVYLALILLLVRPGSSIGTILACLAAQIATTTALVAFFGSRAVGGRTFASPSELTWSRARKLFTFGLWSQITSATAVINLEADKVIISRSLGAAQVTPYHVANRLALLNRFLPLQLLGALLPEITARVSRGLQLEEMERVYLKALRALMIYTLIITGFVVAASDALLVLWLGRRIDGASALTAALAISYAVNNATGIGTTMFRAQGKPWYETYYGLISAVLNVVVTIILIRPYGLVGVIWGTIVGNVIGSCFFIILFHFKTGIPWWSSTGTWLGKALAITGAAGLAYWMIQAAIANEDLGRLHAFVTLCIGGLSYCATFFAVGWLLSFWTQQELALLRAPLKSIRAARLAGSGQDD